MNKKVIIIVVIVALVLCCIISAAILLGTGAFGVSKANQSARDTQRRYTLNEMQVGIVSYEITNSRLPKIEMSKSEIIVGDKMIDISEKTYLSPSSDGKSDSNQTAYCFKPINNSYALGVKEEDGDWYYITLEKCDESSLIY